MTLLIHSSRSMAGMTYHYCPPNPVPVTLSPFLDYDLSLDNLSFNIGLDPRDMYQ